MTKKESKSGKAAFPQEIYVTQDSEGLLAWQEADPNDFATDELVASYRLVSVDKVKKTAIFVGVGE